MGNILLLRRHDGFRYIDILNYQYGQDGGNQVLSITDSGTDADQYNTIEYHSGDVQADTTMFYDKNGNLVSDADRRIMQAQSMCRPIRHCMSIRIWS